MSIARTIAWELFQRNRIKWFFVSGVLLLGGTGAGLYGAISNSKPAIADIWGYLVVGTLLMFSFACFHYTEGPRRGGFGGFPRRLFTLPVRTGWIVLWPMVFGVFGVSVVYMAAVWVFLRPLGIAPSLLWPCLYLGVGLVGFQTVLWSLPERRYLKLFMLSVLATGLAICWMFFLPDIISGTLREWGYRGSVASFRRLLLIGLVLLLPLGFFVSLFALEGQRHVRSGASWGASILSVRWIAKRSVSRAKFSSAFHAMVWNEWRHCGWVLPGCMGVVILLAHVPSYLTGPHQLPETQAMITFSFLAPLLLSAVIGRGFGKPDFWRSDMAMPLFQAVKPVRPGDRLVVKMAVAGGSVGLTWCLVVLSLGLWLCWVGDPEAVRTPWLYLRGFYPRFGEQVLLILLSFLLALTISWRLMLGALVSGQSRKPWFYGSSNVLFVVGLLGIVGMVLYLLGDDNRGPSLWELWPLVERLPVVLMIVLCLRMTLACWLWLKVYHQGMASLATLQWSWGSWLIISLILSSLIYYLAPHGVWWLRGLLALSGLFVCPLLGPGLAVLGSAGQGRGR